jgi:hypothetical protein
MSILIGRNKQSNHASPEIILTSIHRHTPPLICTSVFVSYKQYAYERLGADFDGCSDEKNVA